jgi:uncharacterized lipoprotein YddW (UPF0748 family)
MLKKLFLAALLSAPFPGCDGALLTSNPPDIVQEFRGVWIATVSNTDWPSKPGLPVAQQKAELLAILDRAVKFKLNAVIFQVRPQCDAFYASPFEPWSEYLTGTMGKAPSPYYDPLAFAVEEAHKRGLELHAWFNPYRAMHFSHAGSVATNHISRTHPELVRSYGKYLWLDPGEPEVQNLAVKVVLDVVKRYDIDGVQFDDYFYMTRQDAGATSDFPDEASWKKFGRGDRADWRRANVDSLIQRTYHEIKTVKPWVKFGVSPAGIWRANVPAGIKGMDAYTELYADSRKWLLNQWVDYLAPQLYWPMDPPEQSFGALARWWAAQAQQKRHVWPGLALFKADKWNPGEIASQIRLARTIPGIRGYLLYRAAYLMRLNPDSMLENDVNAVPAVPPPFAWLTQGFPTPPAVSVTRSAAQLMARWKPTDASIVRCWVVQTASVTGNWTTQVLPGQQLSASWRASAVNTVVVRAVDRVGMISGWTIVDAAFPSGNVNVAARANPSRTTGRTGLPHVP